MGVREVRVNSAISLAIARVASGLASDLAILLISCRRRSSLRSIETFSAMLSGASPLKSLLEKMRIVEAGDMVGTS